jgi:hypothetical protein
MPDRGAQVQDVGVERLATRERGTEARAGLVELAGAAVDFLLE